MSTEKKNNKTLYEIDLLLRSHKFFPGIDYRIKDGKLIILNRKMHEDVELMAKVMKYLL